MIKQGELRLKIGRERKPCHVALLEQSLYLFEYGPVGDLQDLTTILILPLRRVCVIPAPCDLENEFRVWIGEVGYSLYAKSIGERMIWIQKIERAQQDCLERSYMELNFNRKQRRQKSPSWYNSFLASIQRKLCFK